MKKILMIFILLLSGCAWAPTPGVGVSVNYPVYQSYPSYRYSNPQYSPYYYPIPPRYYHHDQRWHRHRGWHHGH